MEKKDSRSSVSGKHQRENVRSPHYTSRGREGKKRSLLASGGKKRCSVLAQMEKKGTSFLLKEGRRRGKVFHFLKQEKKGRAAGVKRGGLRTLSSHMGHAGVMSKEKTLSVSRRVREAESAVPLPGLYSRKVRK